MKFFDFANPLEIYQQNLPHWRQHDVPYFVTFRLADSIPESKRQEWQFERENWHATHRPPYSADELQEYHFLFSERVQEWLDAGHGSCVLTQPEARNIVEQSLLKLHEKQYVLDEFIVMPNHVHALVSPCNGFFLETIVGAWKSVTAHRINKMTGKSGQLWQHETYDHLVRSEKQLTALRAYIRNNPRPK